MSQRVWILCEDRMHEQILRAWCKWRGIQVVRADLPARGVGDASDWVRKKYPETLKKWRSETRRQDIGLLVATDGDRADKRRLATSVRESSGDPPRQATEAAAFLIPTWSIETWVLFLHNQTVVPEYQPSKRRTDLHPLLAHPERGTLTSPALQQVLDAFTSRKSDPHLPSLLDGYDELDRLG